jgi:hypothetical protein
VNSPEPGQPPSIHWVQKATSTSKKEALPPRCPLSFPPDTDFPQSGLKTTPCSSSLQNNNTQPDQLVVQEWRCGSSGRVTCFARYPSPMKKRINLCKRVRAVWTGTPHPLGLGCSNQLLLSGQLGGSLTITHCLHSNGASGTLRSGWTHSQLPISLAPFQHHTCPP